MNPLTMIMILSICCVVSSVFTITLSVIAYKRKKEINQISLELADYDNRLSDAHNLIQAKQQEVLNKAETILKQEQSLKQYDFKFNEQVRLNNESESELKAIISEHDNEMRKQRQKFEILLEKEYIVKADVIKYVQQAFKIGSGKVLKLADYIKEFKANL